MTRQAGDLFPNAQRAEHYGSPPPPHVPVVACVTSVPAMAETAETVTVTSVADLPVSGMRSAAELPEWADPLDGPFIVDAGGPGVSRRGRSRRDTGDGAGERRSHPGLAAVVRLLYAG